MRIIKTASALLCGLLFIAAASSDEPKPTDAAVKGLITINGKPLAHARVFFHLKDGQFIGCRLTDTGKFAIDRVPTGEYTVTVEGDNVPAKYSEEKVAILKIKISDGRNDIRLELLQ